VTGPGHDPSFSVEVKVGDQFQAVADGGTKQEAEQAAARLALASLDLGDGAGGVSVEIAPASVAEAHRPRDLGDGI
jgi:hypothetical protein